MLFQLRLAAKVQAAIYNVNIDPKKHRKLTEEDFMPPKKTKATEGPSEEELTKKLNRVFGALAGANLGSEEAS